MSDALATIADDQRGSLEEIAQQTAVRVNERTLHNRPGRKLGWGISPNIVRASASREKKPRPKAAAPKNPPAVVRAFVPPSVEINGRALAVIADYDDLWRGIRGRVDSMGITREELNYQAKMQDGYAGKLLGAKQVKKFGIASLGKTLGAIGCRLLLVEDPVLTAKIMAHYKKRVRPLRADSANAHT